MFVERFQHPVGMESSTCSVFDAFILASSVDSERADLCTPSTGWWLYKSTQGAQVRCWYKSTRGVGRVVVQMVLEPCHGCQWPLPCPRSELYISLTINLTIVIKLSLGSNLSVVTGYRWGCGPFLGSSAFRCLGVRCTDKNSSL